MVYATFSDTAKEEKKGMRIAKAVIRFTVGTLVEIFVGAVTNSVIGNVDGSKLAKVGAKAGGFLVGMMIGDKVGDYICDSIDETCETLEDLKSAIEEEEEDE